jgi:hypothetical protein
MSTGHPAGTVNPELRAVITGRSLVGVQVEPVACGRRVPRALVVAALFTVRVAGMVDMLPSEKLRFSAAV